MEPNRAADSSLDMDWRAKSRLYAHAGLPIYWLINVADRVIEVYIDPDPAAAPSAYRARTDFRPGQDAPVVLDVAAVAHVPAANLLP
ncbi:Uma2 family endonuclease [bacterium]|nr:Uma2 family endonuclease [bacterium]